jgi:hypothetical protein
MGTTDTEGAELTELPASQLAFMAALKAGTAFKGDGRAFRAGFDAALAWKLPMPQPRTITTTAELDALPDGSVVATCYGDAVNLHRSVIPDAESWHFIVQSGPATVLREGRAA